MPDTAASIPGDRDVGVIAETPRVAFAGRLALRSVPVGHAVGMSVPQRLTFVTLGAHELPALRQFYRAIGWTENDGSDDSFASFDCGSVKLALYPVDLLRDEAAPGAELPRQEVWNGVTLAVNLSSRAEVRDVYAAAIACGATAVAEPTERDWGGFSGYIADPEGNRWELAWAPGFDSF